MKQNSEVKPVIRLSLTVQDRLLEIAGWLFLILQWLVVLYYYSGLPELILPYRQTVIFDRIIFL